jgi:hypothetical protein
MGVGRTGHHTRHSTVEHGEVILMVTHSKNIRRRHIKQPAEFGKGASLIVEAMAKSEIDITALVMKIILSSRQRIQSGGDVIQNFLTLGNESLGNPLSISLQDDSWCFHYQIPDLFEKIT